MILAKMTLHLVFKAMLALCCVLCAYFVLILLACFDCYFVWLVFDLSCDFVVPFVVLFVVCFVFALFLFVFGRGFGLSSVCFCCSSLFILCCVCCFVCRFVVLFCFCFAFLC